MSIWWVIGAFFLGSCVGVLVMALMRMAARTDEPIIFVTGRAASRLHQQRRRSRQLGHAAALQSES